MLSCVIFFLSCLPPPDEPGSVAILDESLLYFGLLIGALMTGWSLWMLFLYIKKTPAQRKNSSVGLWIIILALLLGLGALGKPMRTVIERIRSSSMEIMPPGVELETAHRIQVELRSECSKETRIERALNS
ncbi:MAG: hypothetical protein CMF59_03800 [Leptospiraceae bacterium]|nr:hypothetical protein [Leptospiraceae bacterium]